MNGSLAAFQEIAQSRRSVKTYDPENELDDATLKELFDVTLLSPSSFNLQHWRFIVVRSPEVKQQIREAAFGQEQITSSSAVICVCGKLNAHEDAAEIYADAPAAVQESMLPMIAGFYAENPALQRDEAIRSASLASMSLMYAAHSMGLATGPMIGFDQARVIEILEIPENVIPVMLIVIGKQTGDMRPRSMRWSIEKVVRSDSYADHMVISGGRENR